MSEHPDAPTAEPARVPSPTPGRASAPSRSSMGTTILFALAAVIAVGGVAFAVGRLTAPTSSSASRAGGFSRGAFAPTGSFRPGAAGGLGTGDVSLEGTVQSITGSTLTLRTSSGQTVTIDLGSGTTYHNAAAASPGAVTPGSQVQVRLAVSGAGASPVPGASGAARTVTASDVTLVAP